MRLIDESAAGPLPNAICVGVEKGGSTSLYDCLRAHPDVYMSPVKETNFFSTDVRVENFRDDYQRHERQKKLDLDAYFRQPELTDIWGAYVREPEHYLRLYAAGGDYAVRGEVSNSYLYSHEAARNIADTLPEARILVILRDPVARAYSHFRAMVRDGRTEKAALIDEIEYDRGFADRRWGSCHGYIDHGMYAQQLERLFAAVDRERVKVILAEDFFADRAASMADIYAFLGLPDSTAHLDAANRNMSVAPRSAGLIRFLSRTGLKRRVFRLVPERYRSGIKGLFFTGNGHSMTTAEADFLGSFYRDEIPAVEELLGVRLDAWRKRT